MLVNLDREPFSRFGSWHSFFVHKKETPRKIEESAPVPSSPLGPGLYLRSHHARGVIRREVAKLEFLGPTGTVIQPQFVCTPWELSARFGRSVIRISFDEIGRIAVRGEGMGLRFRIPPQGVVAAWTDDHDRITVNARYATRRYQFKRFAGSLKLSTAWTSNEGHEVECLPVDGVFEVLIEEEFWSTWISTPSKTQAQIRSDARLAWERFLEPFVLHHGTSDTIVRDSWERAVYVLWSAGVSPCGLLKRPAILMSKHGMDQVWSWDHCFVAMALAGRHDELAWDQWLLPFDLQDNFGALPDGFNDVFQHFNFCKPPVHGWALGHILQTSRRQPEPDRFALIYDRLAKQTRWFLEHRCSSALGLPFYLHGNDSGWDNSSMFDEGVPLVAPDLAALLVLQCEQLAQLAAATGNSSESKSWQRESQKLYKAMDRSLWRRTGYVPLRLTGNYAFPVSCRSLIPAIPIILARRLKSKQLRILTDTIKGFATAYGVATERTDSPCYVADGYWRGPVWGPSTLLIVEGLAAAGETALARAIATAYVRTCSAAGFAENFDAQTGFPLRDPAYTWTAATFLLLAQQFGECL